MNPQRSKQPTIANIFSWALRRLSYGDYYFTQDGSDGGWELNIWECPEGDLSPEDADIFKKLAEAIVDGRVAPEIILRHMEGSPELPSEKQMSALLHSSLKAAIGFCLLDARRRLGKSEVAQFETRATREAPQGVSDSIALGLLGETASIFPKMVKRAEELRVLEIEYPVPDGVQQYVVEFSKCYISGRFFASLLVCRATIELALRDFLNRSGKKRELLPIESSEQDGLFSLIQCARSLDKWKLAPTLDDADEVRRRANAVAHKGELNPELCKTLIIKTRGILKELYS
jgi:hypothetical protein